MKIFKKVFIRTHFVLFLRCNVNEATLRHRSSTGAPLAVVFPFDRNLFSSETKMMQITCEVVPCFNNHPRIGLFNIPKVAKNMHMTDQLFDFSSVRITDDVPKIRIRRFYLEICVNFQVES